MGRCAGDVTEGRDERVDEGMVKEERGVVVDDDADDDARGDVAVSDDVGV